MSAAARSPLPLPAQMALLLLAGLLGGLVVAVAHPERLPWSEAGLLGAGEITLADALALEEAVWIDARERGAYEAGHIPGAILLNETEWNTLLPGFFARWAPGHPVVVYCDSRQCDTSHHVADRLREEAGLPEVHVLFGGWETWREHRAEGGEAP